MANSDKKRIVISLGGSLIVPEEIDKEFLASFRDLILSKKDQYQFLIIIGGGKTCRKYQQVARDLNSNELVEEDLDWIGIYTTRLNAIMVMQVFKPHCHTEMILDPKDVKGIESDIIFGAGFEPGYSTDVDAVEMAKTVGAGAVLNLSNISYVYSEDPKKNPDARRYEQIKWSEYRTFIPEKWTSGLNTPFDPIASKQAEELNLKVIIMNGANLSNLKNFLEEKPFEGTIIS